jgi:aminoglycoside 6'-N-acetyltransferase I
MRIVPLAIEHLDACVRLYISVFNGEPWNDCWTAESAHARLADTFSTPGFLGVAAVDDDGGDLLGMILGHSEQWFDGRQFYLKEMCLKEMCVRAELQRTGVGSALLRHLENALRTMSVGRVYLLTLKESAAEAFYAKNGYDTSSKMGLMAHRL